MANLYTVTATLLNLRSSAFSGDNSNVITQLKNGEVVDVVDASQVGWYKVRAINRNPVAEGFAASQYLTQLDPSSPASNIGFLKPVNLGPNPASRRDNHGAWQYPLSEPDMPRVTATGIADRISQMHDIVNYLAVDTSARYARDVYTYCNIYAYDYCYLSNVFLPRVWWTQKAIIALQSGQVLKPSYNVNVTEMNANALFAWLEEWGDDFGWKRTYHLNELQDTVNQGRNGLISGPNVNPNRSGHISCVIPEKDNHVAMRSGGNVVCPLLSQAGAQNLRFYNNNKWWLLRQIKEFGFWYL